MPVTFPLATVEPARNRLARAYPSPHLGRIITQFTSDRPLVHLGEEHALAQAVRMAWASHYPLSLSPDAVWLTILGGLSRHISVDPEAARQAFVAHAGKLELVVPVLDLPQSQVEWLAVLDAFAQKIERNTTAEWASWSLCDFSTSGPLERAASRAMLMSALKPYFDYVMSIICGIPSITVEGTPADWEAIRNRTALLERAGLGWWLAELMPVLDQFVEAAHGRFDTHFWSGIYSWTPPAMPCVGRAKVDGWIHCLFPYFDNLASGGAVKNEYFEGQREGLADPGLCCSGFREAPVTVTYRGVSKDIRILGGLAGVSQDAATLAVRPEAGLMVAACGTDQR